MGKPANDIVKLTLVSKFHAHEEVDKIKSLNEYCAMDSCSRRGDGLKLPFIEALVRLWTNAFGCSGVDCLYSRTYQGEETVSKIETEET
jgi:hypothetical protein